MNQNEFIEALKELNIKINSNQLKQLEKYYDLLTEWNEKINLTRIVEKEEVYLKHFYDSATIVKVIDLNNINTMCDFGTGAGFPGVVLKILFPNLKMTLVDSLNKRINFLNIVIKELNLKDIEAIHTRVEDYGKINREKYDCVVARAVSNLSVILEYAIPLIKVKGFFVAMKGNIDDELENSQSAIKKLGANLIKIETFLLPNENSTRNILLFTKNEKTKKIYPRSFANIKNNKL